MVVMTAKLSKKKLIAVLVAAAALIIIIVLCAKSGGSPEQNAADANDERLAFLSSFGYTVNGEPAEAGVIRIPAESSEVFDRYNELQRSQGYDLTGYAGRQVNRYVYALENYDETGTVWYATVLCADGEIIGGDVANAEPGGKMHGFKRPAGE